jgi:hypothetical protein
MIATGKIPRGETPRRGRLLKTARLNTIPLQTGTAVTIEIVPIDTIVLGFDTIDVGATMTTIGIKPPHGCGKVLPLSPEIL